MANTWCVLTKTRGGTVSLLRGLTKREAEETARQLAPKLRGFYNAARPSSWMSLVSDSDIELVRIFNGAGEEP